MKANIGKWAVIVLLGVLATGCSSIRARTETLESEWKIYPGVRQDMKEMGEIFRGERPRSAWLNGLVTFMLIVDLPFSSIFDTFALPYDLSHIPNPRTSQGYPVTAKGPQG